MKQKFTAEQLEGFWRDPANWKWGVYRCAADPRVIVSKRAKWMGWTVNFARPSAVPVLLLIVLLMGAPLVALAVTGRVNTPVWFVTLVLEVVILCLACWYLASPKRFE